MIDAASPRLPYTIEYMISNRRHGVKPSPEEDHTQQALRVVEA